MKLYYNNNTDKLVEGGVFNDCFITRDEFGEIETSKDSSSLELIGEIYDKPIQLPKNTRVRLSKVTKDFEQTIIIGNLIGDKLEEGLRCKVEGSMYDWYSTNLVVHAEYLSKTGIVFHTLSGSLYILEIL